MEDLSRYTPTPAGEMDLTEMLRRLLVYFRKNRAIFIVSCVLGLVIAALLYKLSPRVYSTRLVLESTVLNSHEQEEIVSNWDDQLNKRGYDGLAQIFGCTPELVSQIDGLKAEQVGLPMEGNTAFALTLKTTDTLRLKELQEALLHGLKNNEYSRRRIAVRKENLEEEIAKAQQQLNTLDSNELILGRKHEGSGRNPDLLLDVSTIPEQQMLIHEKLMGYKEKLAFMTDILVLQDFLRPKKVSPILPLFGIVGLFGGFLIGYIYSLVSVARSIIKRKG
jgi:hypothetical protein